MASCLMKSKAFRRSLSIVLAVLQAALLTCCSPSKEEKTRIGYLPIASDASFFVAVEQGFFKSEGLDVEPVKFETSNQALEALVAGRIDATAVVGLEAVLALEANTPSQFRIVEMTAATDKTRVHRMMVKPDSPIQTLADLKGKKVGTFPGSQMVVFLKLILGAYFDAEKEVEIIQLKPPLQPQALETSQVDALFCLEPTGTLLEAKGIGRVISSNPLYEFIQKPFPTAAGVVSVRLQNNSSQTVSKIIAALRTAHEFIRTRPADVAVPLSKYAAIEPDLAPRVGLYDYWDLDSIDRAAVQKLADLYANKGIVTKPISTAELYASQPK